MRRSHRVVLCLSVLGLSVLAGRPVQAAEEAARSTIGYVNVSKIFDGYQHAQDVDRSLSEKGKKKEEERAKLVEEVQKLREGMDLLSDDARAARQKEGQERVRKLQDFEQATVQALQEERNTAARDVFKEIDQAIEAYAKEHGLVVVLNERAVVYTAESLDITKDILERLNSQYKPR